MNDQELRDKFLQKGQEILNKDSNETMKKTENVSDECLDRKEWIVESENNISDSKSPNKKINKWMIILLFFGILYGGYRVFWGDYSLSELEKKARRGDPIAQIDLGIEYLQGDHVPKNLEKALQWFKLAADQGNPMAQINVGVAYAKGEGVKKNPELATKWFRLAADQGNARAQFYLGNRYMHGEGIGQNKQKGLEWFRLSADQEFSEAQYGLGLAYYHGDGVSQSYEEAMRLFTLSANQNYAESQYAIGLMYSKGKGVYQDKNTAKFWFKKACKNGMSLACNKY